MLLICANQVYPCFAHFHTCVISRKSYHAFFCACLHPFFASIHSPFLSQNTLCIYLSLLVSHKHAATHITYSNLYHYSLSALCGFVVYHQSSPQYIVYWYVHFPFPPFHTLNSFFYYLHPLPFSSHPSAKSPKGILKSTKRRRSSGDKNTRLCLCP